MSTTDFINIDNARLSFLYRSQRGIPYADAFEREVSEIFREMMPVFQEKAHSSIRCTCE